MRLTIGGWPLYAPDPDGQLYAHINQFIRPLMMTTPNSDRGLIHSKACEPLEPLRTARITPCPPLNLYQLYYPGGWDNYARMWVLMDANSLFRLSENTWNDEAHEETGDNGTSTAKEQWFYYQGAPEDWSVFPFRASWAERSPIENTAIPLPFGGFVFISSGRLIDLEIPMRVNRWQQISERPRRLNKNGDDVPWEDELTLEAMNSVFLVELVDLRHAFRQQLAPKITLLNPTWPEFAANLNRNLPNPLFWTKQTYIPDGVNFSTFPLNQDAFMRPDLSQLDRPGTPITQIWDCFPREYTRASGGAKLRSIEMPTTGSPRDKPPVFDEGSTSNIVNDRGFLAETARYTYLFPRYVNGKHRPDLEPFAITDGKYERGIQQHIVVTSSNPAKFIDENQDCPFNIADLKLLTQIDRSQNEQRLGSVETVATYSTTDFSQIDFWLTDFLGAFGPTTTTKWLNLDQVRNHSYCVMEQPVKKCEEVRRIRLLENLPVCSDAMAYILTDGDLLPEDVACSQSGSASSSGEPVDNCPCNTERVVLVRDTAGIARSKISRSLTDNISNSVRFAPSNSMGFARPLRCSNNSEEVYELISIGQGCECESASSGPEDCCEVWFTRFENLGSVTSKPVGSQILKNETIGTTKSSGNASLTYMAWLSNSMDPSVGGGCTIDLSSIHSFPTKNTRPAGQTPCTNSYSQCSIEYAKTKMAGGMPLTASACNYFDDLSVAQTGSLYYQRTIKSNPETCSYNKKVYNFTSGFTRLHSVGADYVVLRHECIELSSESSDGLDPCCVVLTDHDVRCIGGQLQTWKKETEVCWDGDCLVATVVNDWMFTGQEAGCCDCGSESGVESSCVNGVNVNEPGTGYQSGGALWNITSSSYNMSTGAWSVTAIANANAGLAPSCGATASCAVQANAGSNPSVTSCVPGTGPYCSGQTITVSGTSTPPTLANCATWRVQSVTNNVTSLAFAFTCDACPAGAADPCNDCDNSLILRLVFGNETYNVTVPKVSQCNGEGGIDMWNINFDTSSVPACLADDWKPCGGWTRLQIGGSVRCFCQPTADGGTGDYRIILGYTLWNGAAVCSSGTFINQLYDTNPLPLKLNGTGTASNGVGTWNTDCPWSIRLSCNSGGVGGLQLLATGVASDVQGTLNPTLANATTTSSGLSANVMASADILLDLATVQSGNQSANLFGLLTGVTVSATGSTGII